MALWQTIKSILPFGRPGARPPFKQWLEDKGFFLREDGRVLPQWIEARQQQILAYDELSGWSRWRKGRTYRKHMANDRIELCVGLSKALIDSVEKQTSNEASVLGNMSTAQQARHEWITQLRFHRKRLSKDDAEVFFFLGSRFLEFLPMEPTRPAVPPLLLMPSASDVHKQTKKKGILSKWLSLFGSSIKQKSPEEAFESKLGAKIEHFAEDAMRDGKKIFSKAVSRGGVRVATEDFLTSLSKGGDTKQLEKEAFFESVNKAIEQVYREYNHQVKVAYEDSDKSDEKKLSLCLTQDTIITIFTHWDAWLTDLANAYGETGVDKLNREKKRQKDEWACDKAKLENLVYEFEKYTESLSIINKAGYALYIEKKAAFECEFHELKKGLLIKYHPDKKSIVDLGQGNKLFERTKIYVDKMGKDKKNLIENSQSKFKLFLQGEEHFEKIKADTRALELSFTKKFEEQEKINTKRTEALLEKIETSKEENKEIKEENKEIKEELSEIKELFATLVANHQTPAAQSTYNNRASFFDYGKAQELTLPEGVATEPQESKMDSILNTSV